MTDVSKKVAVVKKDITVHVLAKVESFKNSGELKIPKDYSPENALKSAYLILAETSNKQGQNALTHCTQESIANALLKMVVWGLSPLKKQCDLIMYGKKLECSIEYTGNIALARRYGGLKNISGVSVRKGDEFEFEVDTATGRKKVTKHKQTLESLSGEVIGAYAVKELMDGTFDTEIMNMNQIRKAWNQGAMKGNSPAHKNFPGQMSIKTVINRACKLLIRGSDDRVLGIGGDDNETTIDVVAEDVKSEIEENANTTVIEIEAEDVKEIEIEAKKVEAPIKKKPTTTTPLKKDVDASGQVDMMQQPGF
jgi:recombination protein RecT